METIVLSSFAILANGVENHDVDIHVLRGRGGTVGSYIILSRIDRPESYRGLRLRNTVILHCPHMVDNQLTRMAELSDPRGAIRREHELLLDLRYVCQGLKELVFYCWETHFGRGIDGSLTKHRAFHWVFLSSKDSSAKHHGHLQMTYHSISL
jgi:hypothetical protein